MRRERELSPKEQHWQAYHKRVSAYDPDQPIDGVVLDAVVGLNLLGIQTVSACGGHRDYRPLQGPYISFVKEHDETDPFASGRKDDRRVQEYIDEFYTTEKPSVNSRLVVEENRSGGAIYNQANRARIFPKEDYLYGPSGPDKIVGRIELYTYKRQMRRFGLFLKEKYINSPGKITPPANQF